MGVKVSESQRREIRRLWKKGKGYTISEISRKLGLAKSTVYVYTRARDRGFKTPVQYLNHLAEQKGNSSVYERQEELLKKRGYTRLSYIQELLKRNDCSSLHQQRKKSLKKRGKTYTQYRENLSKKKGHKSYSDYRKFLDIQRRTTNHKNIIISNIIRHKLKKLKKTQIKAAKEIGVNRIIFGRWYAGDNFPSEKYHSPLSEVLILPRSDIDVWVGELEEKVKSGEIPEGTYKIFEANNPYKDVDNALETAAAILNGNGFDSWPSYRKLRKRGHKRLATAICNYHGINNFKKKLEEYLMKD